MSLRAADSHTRHFPKNMNLPDKVHPVKHSCDCESCDCKAIPTRATSDVSATGPVVRVWADSASTARFEYLSGKKREALVEVVKEREYLVHVVFESTKGTQDRLLGPMSIDRANTLCGQIMDSIKASGFCQIPFGDANLPSPGPNTVVIGKLSHVAVQQQLSTRRILILGGNRTTQSFMERYFACQPGGMLAVTKEDFEE